MASSLLQQLSLLGGIPSFTPDNTDPTPPPAFQWNKWKIGLVAVASVPVIASVALAIFATITLQWHIAAGAVGVAGIILTGTWILIGRPTLDDMAGSSTRATPDEQLALLQSLSSTQGGTTQTINLSGNTNGSKVRVVDPRLNTTNTSEKTTSLFTSIFRANSRDPIPSLENEQGVITIENAVVAMKWALKNKDTDFDDEEEDEFNSLVSKIQDVIFGKQSEIYARNIDETLMQEFCTQFPIEIDLGEIERVLNDIHQKDETRRRECLQNFEETLNAVPTTDIPVNAFSEQATKIINHDAHIYLDGSTRDTFSTAMYTLLSLWDNCKQPTQSSPIDTIGHYRQKFEAASRFIQLIDEKANATQNPNLKAYLTEIKEAFENKQLKLLEEWIQFSNDRLDLRPSYTLTIGEKTFSDADIQKEIDTLSAEKTDLQAESMFASNRLLIANSELEMQKSQLSKNIHTQKTVSLNTADQELLLTSIQQYQENPDETKLRSIAAIAARIKGNTEEHIASLEAEVSRIQEQQRPLSQKLTSSNQIIDKINEFFSPDALHRSTWDTNEILSDIILLLEEANKLESNPLDIVENNKIIKLIELKIGAKSYDEALEKELKTLASNNSTIKIPLIEAELRSSSQAEQNSSRKIESLRELSTLSSNLMRSIATLSSENAKLPGFDSSISSLTDNISRLEKIKLRKEQEHLLHITTPGGTILSARKWQNYLEAFVINLSQHNVPTTSWTEIILNDIRSKYDPSLFSQEFENELRQNIINTLPDECKPTQQPNEPTSSSSSFNQTPTPVKEEEFNLMHDAIVTEKLPLLGAMSSTSQILQSPSLSSKDSVKEKTVFEILNTRPLSGAAQEEAKKQNAKILAFINKHYANDDAWDKITPIEQTITGILFLFATGSRVLSKDQMEALVEELKTGQIAFPKNSWLLVNAPLAALPETSAANDEERSIVHNLMKYSKNKNANREYIARWKASLK
jgi:hypothetical protein